MSNVLQTTDLLGAELLCGYSYFQAQNELNNLKNAECSNLQKYKARLIELEADLQKAHDTIPKLTDQEILSSPKFAQYYEEAKQFHEESFFIYLEEKQRNHKISYESAERSRKLQLSNAQGQNGKISKENKKATARLIFSLLAVILVLGVLATTLTLGIVGVKNDQNHGIGFLVASFWVSAPLVFFVLRKVIRLAKDGKFKFQKQKKISHFTFSQEFEPLNEEQLKKEYWKKFPDTPQKYLNYLNRYEKQQVLKLIGADQIENKVALAQNALSNCQQKIVDQQQLINAIDVRIEMLKAEGQQIASDLTEIPVYYFQEESVLQMLFFYVNKRANNVTDLINLYEQKIFQDRLINAVNSVKISIDNLSKVINDNFVRLGLQLGVINQSINANTSQLILNKNKLSQIQDEVSRNYIKTVDHINNVKQIVQDQYNYVKTNPTTITANITVNTNDN